LSKYFPFIGRTGNIATTQRWQGFPSSDLKFVTEYEDAVHKIQVKRTDAGKHGKNHGLLSFYQLIRVVMIDGMPENRRAGKGR